MYFYPLRSRFFWGIIVKLKYNPFIRVNLRGSLMSKEIEITTERCKEVLSEAEGKTPLELIVFGYALKMSDDIILKTPNPHK